MAHRKELIDQTVETFARLGFPSVSVIKGKDRRFDPRNPIRIASVQTLVKRDPVPDIDVWVIDECHRALAASYLKSIFMAYPQSLFLGLTATPCGPNGKPMGAVFDSLVIGARYSELIAQGHIVAPIVFSTPTQADYRRVVRRAGITTLKTSRPRSIAGRSIGNLVEEWKRHAEGRRTVVFAVSVAHSKAIQDRFAGLGVACEHLDGTTPEATREAILARLGRGQTDVVVNVGVLTEGWDCPPVKCCILARPTKSLALYMQMAGRTLRPWHDTTPIILDHGGNVDRHGMPHEDRDWSLTTKPKRTGAAPCKLCKVCFAYIARACGRAPTAGPRGSGRGAGQGEGRGGCGAGEEDGGADDSGDAAAGLGRRARGHAVGEGVPVTAAAGHRDEVQARMGPAPV